MPASVIDTVRCAVIGEVVRSARPAIGLVKFRRRCHHLRKTYAVSVSQLSDSQLLAKLSEINAQLEELNSDSHVALPSPEEALSD